MEDNAFKEAEERLGKFVTGTPLNWMLFKIEIERLFKVRGVWKHLDSSAPHHVNEDGTVNEEAMALQRVCPVGKEDEYAQFLVNEDKKKAVELHESIMRDIGPQEAAVHRFELTTKHRYKLLEIDLTLNAVKNSVWEQVKHFDLLERDFKKERTIVQSMFMNHIGNSVYCIIADEVSKDLLRTAWLKLHKQFYNKQLSPYDEVSKLVFDHTRGSVADYWAAMKELSIIYPVSDEVLMRFLLDSIERSSFGRNKSVVELIEGCKIALDYEDSVRLLQKKIADLLIEREQVKTSSKRARMKNGDDFGVIVTTCYHCQRVGHTTDECWSLHPELRPNRNKKRKTIEIKVEH